MGLVASANTFVTRFARQGAGEFAPRCVCEDAVLHTTPVGRVGVFAVKRSDVHLAVGDELGVNEFSNVCNSLHAASGVGQGNESMGFATAVACIQAEDRCGGTAVATEAGHNILEQVAQASGG